MIGKVIVCAANLMDACDNPLDVALHRTHQAVRAGLMAEAALWVSVAFTLARSERIADAHPFTRVADLKPFP